jgi:hypothetical protein
LTDFLSTGLGVDLEAMVLTREGWRRVEARGRAAEEEEVEDVKLEVTRYRRGDSMRMALWEDLAAMGI